MLQSGPVSLVALGFFGIGVGSSLLNVYLLTRTNLRPILSMFLFFISQYFGFAPAVQISSNKYPGTTPDPPIEYEGIALIYIFIILIFVLIGYTFKNSQKVFEGSCTEIPEQNFKSIRVPRFEILFLLVLLNVLYIAVIGLSNFFTSYYELGLVMEAKFQTRIFIAIVRALGTLPLAVCLAMIVNRALLKQLPLNYRFLFFSGCTTLLISCNPISSYRVMVGLVWGTIILSKSLQKSRKTFNLSYRAYVIALIYLFPIADYFRNAKRDFANPISRDSLTRGDFDSYVQLLNSFAFIMEKGIGWGIHAISLPLFWVPRSFWPSKPVDSAILIADFRGYSFNNLSMPLMGESLLDFGLLGSGLFFVVIGRYFFRIDRYFASNAIAQSKVQIFTLFLIPYSLMLFRGSLLQAVSPIAVVFVATRVLNYGVFNMNVFLSAPGSQKKKSANKYSYPDKFS